MGKTVKFVPRLTAPSTSDKYWIHASRGGLNDCIHIGGGSVLPNCVGYAWGRFYELTGEKPRLSRANAEDWYGNTADGYKRSATPKLGAVACWRKGKVFNSADGCGHVAIVERIEANGDIVTSNSAYGGTRFYTQTYKSINNYNSGTLIFQGFILPPVDFSAESETPSAPLSKEDKTMALNIPGVDISYCQQGLNYEKLKADGIKFAIIRSSVTGTGSHKQSVDSLLNRHVNGCISQGIDYGFYHYSCAVTVAEAKKEAQFCVEQIKRFPLPTYPVFFDAEEMQMANLGKKAATDIALAFIDEVERLGYPSGIYANPSWIETYLDKTRILGKKDLWLAHWVNSPRQYGQKLWQSGLRYSAGMQIDADYCFVDYPKETAAWYKAHGKNVSIPTKKSLDEIVAEVWAGKWGVGQQRYDDLTAAGYDYYAVQDAVNKKIAEQEKNSATPIKIGSKVKLKQGAKTYNGGSLASFVYTRPHTVTEIVGERAVICYGNVVVAAVNVNDLALA